MYSMAITTADLDRSFVTFEICHDYKENGCTTLMSVITVVESSNTTVDVNLALLLNDTPVKDVILRAVDMRHR